MDVACETLNDRPILVNDVWLWTFKNGDKFRDVENFRFVKDPRTDFLIKTSEVALFTSLSQLLAYPQTHRFVSIVTTFL
jgi:hypothetical protein